MQINDLGYAVGYTIGASFLGATVGGLGAHVIKPFLKSPSTVGVALNCGIATTIAIASVCLIKEVIGIEPVIGIMGAFPVASLITNYSKYKVYSSDSYIAFLVGGAIAAPLAWISVLGYFKVIKAKNTIFGA